MTEPSLTALANRYGTDKGSAIGEAHGYAEAYERAFAHLRARAINLLEFGTFEGASLRMWADWFPHARVFCIDIEAPRQLRHDRIVVHEGDGRDVPAAFDGVEFDIVIDDASHRSSAVLQALDVWRHRVRPGGFYAIEDLHVNVRDPAVYADTQPDALRRVHRWCSSPPPPFAHCELIGGRLAILRRGPPARVEERQP